MVGLLFKFHFSLLCPPFQFFVVNPKISTLTAQRSNVLDNISAQIAAIVIGLPRIEPELSISKVTTVSLNSVFFSFLNESELNGSIMTLVNLELSNSPSSRSNCQDLFCFANNCLCNLFANFAITL